MTTSNNYRKLDIHEEFKAQLQQDEIVAAMVPEVWAKLLAFMSGQEKDFENQQELFGKFCTELDRVYRDNVQKHRSRSRALYAYKHTKSETKAKMFRLQATDFFQLREHYKALAALTLVSFVDFKMVWLNEKFVC